MVDASVGRSSSAFDLLSPVPRGAVVVASFLLLSWFCPSSLAALEAGTDPLLQLGFDAATGYDDNLLADPEGIGLLEPAEASLLTVRSWLCARRAGLLGGGNRERGEALLQAGLSGYAKSGIGPDNTLRAGLRYQVGLTDGFLLDGSVAATRFRRHDVPVFDLNAPEGRLRLARALGDRWLVTGELGCAWPSYPGRTFREGGHQRDRRLQPGGSLLRSLGARGFVSARAEWRSVDSNDSLADNCGPVVEVSAGGAEALGLSLAGSIAFSQRDYDAFPVLRFDTGVPEPAGEYRRDRTWQLWASAERRLSRRLNAFAQALWVVHSSNVEALGFHQARVMAGVQVDLLSVGHETKTAPVRWSWRAPPDPLAPCARTDGIRFRVRAPDARCVALVGGFNAWNAGRDLLRGPDADGLWEIVARIPAGTWRYAFVIDGTWVRPEGAPRYEDDGYGGQHGVFDTETLSTSRSEP